MQQAEDELKRLQGSKAVEKQDEAIRKLAEAKERLEKILRQLREEEQEIMLTSLEGAVRQDAVDGDPAPSRHGHAFQDRKECLDAATFREGPRPVGAPGDDRGRGVPRSTF